METEAKAKVVASVGGGGVSAFIKFLAVLPRLMWRKRLISSFSEAPKKSNLTRALLVYADGE